jgi:polyhydroxyalkanoate synthase
MKNENQDGKPICSNSFDGFYNVMHILQNSTKILKKNFQILEQIVMNKKGTDKMSEIFDYSKVSDSISKLFISVFANPDKAIAMQRKYVEMSMEVIDYYIAKGSGRNPPAVYEPDERDRRFKHEEWYTNLQFDFLKQTYLMNAKWLGELIDQAEDIDGKTKNKARFFINQIIDALAPTNFLFTNPQAIQESINSDAASLLKGLDNFLNDLQQNKEIFDITRTDPLAFKIGANIASTPGQVVYKNDLMELIYYTPEKKQVNEIPLLIIPPWINRYYILDLSEKNSFVKWIVSQGLSVFLISWVNPNERLKDKTFEDYAKDGVLNAINFILEKFKKEKVNLLSYCIGGTLTTMLLGYLAAHKRENIVKTSSFLTTLIDFNNTGGISIFIDEEQIQKLESTMDKTGYFDGRIMNLAFSALRANDMIWFFVVNNYLMGKDPLPFDLLYWNAQSTNLPAKMHGFYLRNMYLENNLVKPNKIVMNGTPIDIRKIKTPCYFIATEKDHIAPWKGVYEAINILTCPCEFTLAGSGHVAGIINPADSQKYGYWTNKTIHKNPDDWLKTATKSEGSWWPIWISWLIKNSGKEITATTQNKIADSLAIGKAPGSYVTR